MRNSFIIAVISLAILIAAPFMGRQIIYPSEIFSGGVDAEIFWQLRVPRIVLSYLAGAALSMCGMVFQAVFRNPLATPYTLGVASGASLGAAVFYMLSLPIAGGGSLFAFAGAILTMLVVFAAGSYGNSLLLAGVAVNFTFSAVVIFIQYISSYASTLMIIRFMIGGLETASAELLPPILFAVLLGFAVTLLLRRHLDLLSLGETAAQSRGADVARTKLALFAMTSLVLATVVSITGPIGFVGLMSPHISRLLVGNSHQRLAAASFLFGGGFLTLCDSAARIIIFPAEIPVGVITSILGGPFFIFLLAKNRKKSGSLAS
ncbi:MAG: iron ABC transporter permease [Deferribacteraceae bacterium]|jgi:iron complex transport system permease protein|nr:iron ABC transporter permease [Deferribacteraceae bacterium]